jgi:beta-barrel assembly-enhancing protease
MTRIKLISRSQQYCWFCLVLGAIASLGVVLLQPQAQAQSIWQRLIYQGVQVIQLSTVSAKQEVEIGQQINQQLISKGMRLYSEPNLNACVNQIGQRLVAVSDRNQLPFKFQMVRDGAVNAFATAGGYVYVTTGLMKTADNEAQLASVIGHEIGHIEGKHLLQQLRQTAITRGLVSAAGLDRSAIANLGTELVLSRPLSRKDEFDADQRGLKMMIKANYAESAMPAFMKKLLTQSSVPTFLSTHPAVPARVEALEAAIAKSTGNECDRAPEQSQCGLNNASYQQKVRDRLARYS